MLLDDLRGEIDGIDREMVVLFCRRMEIAARVAAHKQANGLPVRDAAREQAVLDKVAAMAGEEVGPYIREVYAAMFAASRAYQHRLMDDDA